MTSLKYTFLERLLFPNRTLNLNNLKSTLSNKTVLITGASYGIGEQLSYLLSFNSNRLILVGRTEKKLLEVKKKVELSGGKAEIFFADLRINEECDALLSYIKETYDGLDLFVNNAGKSIRRSLSDSLDRFHDFTRTMDINYKAPVKICLSFIPLLEKNEGHIINVSAINALLLPAPKWAAYQASKVGFDQWFRSVSPELNAKKVSTSTAYLPLVRTRMIEPTKSYDKMPALKPKHAALIIANLVITRKRYFKPWWLFFIEWGSFLCQSIIEAFFIRLCKKEKHDKNH